MSLKPLLLLALLLLPGCASVLDHSATPDLDGKAKWALLPIANHTDTPQAGLRAEAITEGLLRSMGVASLTHYPATLSQDALFEPTERKTVEDAKRWAKESGARYAVTGAVDEWRYKVGIDGEPAVGVALSIVDLKSGATVWSAVGGKSGWSREALSSVAQKLIKEMLGSAGVR